VARIDSPAPGAPQHPGAGGSRQGRGPERFLAARAAVVADDGLSAAQRRRSLSDLADRWLAGLLGPTPGAALVAVGGYGRRELLPGSDLDVLLLHDGDSEARVLADPVFYPVWDAGIALDHAVRTLGEAREVAATDLKAVLGLLDARHVAGDARLTAQLREDVLGDWRRRAAHRLPRLAELVRERAERCGELSHLLEPDLVEAYGGLRDTLALRAVAATWLADRPHGRALDEAREWLLVVRDALHRGSGRRHDRLVLEEQGDVAARLGLLDADALLRRVAEAGRAIAYASDVTWRDVDRAVKGRARGGPRPPRRPLADGVVAQEGEAVLALDADPSSDAVLPLRAAAAAAQHGLVLSPHALDRLAAECPSLPVPWPDSARDALVSLLGAGRPALPVWEALDAVGLVVRWLPDWERVRHRPQRTPVHRHTVDRHLVETAVRAAGLARRVARPDLLLLGALFHDLGKGWPGDHSEVGAVIARGLAERLGLRGPDVDVVERLVRHHLLLPEMATRRDLEDPATVATVVDMVGGAEELELLAALTEADATAAGPVAWTPFRAGLVRELVVRARSVVSGTPPPEPAGLDPWQRTLAEVGELAVLVDAPDLHGACRVTVVAPDRPGLLAAVAGVLTLHKLDVKGADLETVGATAVQVWRTVSQFGPPPEDRVLREDVRRAVEGRMDVAARLAARTAAYPRPAVPVPPPRVDVLPGASASATVLQVRAHDEPGLLHRVASAIAACSVAVSSAAVETLGAEAVDVLYLVVDGGPLGEHATAAVLAAVEAALVPAA
jgi:[protein-PII] uridylyltransferase